MESIIVFLISFVLIYFSLSILVHIFPDLEIKLYLILRYIFYFGKYGSDVKLTDGKTFELFPIEVYFNFSFIFLKSIIIWIVNFGSVDVNFNYKFSITYADKNKGTIEYNFEKTISKIE